MPKEQLHIGRVRGYKPNESSRDLSLETPHFVENCNFVTAAEGTFQGLPGPRVMPSKGDEVYELSAKGAPLLSKGEYIIPHAPGPGARHGLLMHWDAEHGRIADHQMPRVSKQVPSKPMTCASDGEGVYCANPWPDGDMGEPNRPALAKRVEYSTFGRQQDNDLRVFEAHLPLPKAVTMDWLNTDDDGVGEPPVAGFRTVKEATADEEAKVVYWVPLHREGGLKRGVNIFYRVSYMYDQYQESPMAPLYFREGMEYWRGHTRPISEDDEVARNTDRARGARDGSRPGSDTTRDGGDIEGGREKLDSEEEALVPKDARRLYKGEVGEEQNWIDGAGYDNFLFRIKVPKGLSDRVTAVNIYRQTTITSIESTPQEGAYQLLEQIPFGEQDGTTKWKEEDDGWTHPVTEDGNQGVTYEQRSGIPEEAEHMDVRYQICAEAEGYMFAAGIWTPDNEHEPRLVLRSKQQRFSMFNYLSDFIRTKQPVTAMAFWGASLWVFEEGHTYRVDPGAMVILDEYEGVGAAGPASVAVTSNYMFVASHQNVWAVGPNGTFMAIGDQINDLEDIKAETRGTPVVTGIENAGFRKHSRTTAPVLVYDARFNSVMLMFSGQDGTVRGWMWHVGREEWLTAINLNKPRKPPPFEVHFEGRREGEGHRKVYGAFTDHQGRAHIITNRGVTRLLDRTDGGSLMPWTYVSPEVHAGHVKFSPYRISLHLGESERADLDSIFEYQICMWWRYDNDYWIPASLVDTCTPTSPFQVDGRTGHYRTQDIPPEPDKFLGKAGQTKIVGQDKVWRRIFGMQVQIEADGSVQITDLNIVIRRFVPRSRLPHNRTR